MIDFIKNLICGICFLVQLVLIIEIGTYICTHEDIGWLILIYIVCECILHIIGETSIIKMVLTKILYKDDE